MKKSRLICSNTELNILLSKKKATPLMRKVNLHGELWEEEGLSSEVGVGGAGRRQGRIKSIGIKYLKINFVLIFHENTSQRLFTCESVSAC